MFLNCVVKVKVQLILCSALSVFEYSHAWIQHVCQEKLISIDLTNRCCRKTH